MRSSVSQPVQPQAPQTDELDEAMLQELWLMSCDDLFVRLPRSASTRRTAGGEKVWLGLAEVA